MKKQYESAKIELLAYTLCDIITLSIGGDDGKGDPLYYDASKLELK